MFQDLERGRVNDIDYINGYAVRVGFEYGVPTWANAAIVKMVQAMTHERMAPAPALLGVVLKESSGESLDEWESVKSRGLAQ